MPRERCLTVSTTIPLTAVKMLHELHNPELETWSKFLARLTLRGMVYEIARQAANPDLKMPKPPPPPPGVEALMEAITEPEPHVLK